VPFALASACASSRLTPKAEGNRYPLDRGDNRLKSLGKKHLDRERSMMNQALLLPKNADRQLIYSGIDWQQFKLIQSGFAEASGIRLAYFNGTIEILMPGRTHELFKSIIGMLIELFCLEMAILHRERLRQRI
jgi:hypothetical protein